MSNGWKATGEVQEISPQVDRIPNFNPVDREHFFIVITSFRVDPTTWTPDSKPRLTGENIVMLNGPVCYYCEHRWTPKLNRTQCLGKPG